MVVFGAMSWLTAATPVWLALLIGGALGVVAWQLWSMRKRMDRHAESIAHMDEWADLVDEKLATLQERARRPVPPAPGPAPRSVAELKKLWQK